MEAKCFGVCPTQKNYNIASDDFIYIAQVIYIYLRISKNISISEKNESPVGLEQHESN